MAKSGAGCSAAWHAARAKQKQQAAKQVCRVKAVAELKRRKGKELEIAPEKLVPREIEHENYKKTGGRPKLKGKPQCALCLKCFRDGYDRKFHMNYHDGTAYLCPHCSLSGVPECDCYFLNGDSFRKHLNGHGWVLLDLRVSDEEIDQELYKHLSQVFKISSDLFNKLQLKAKDFSNPWRWRKVSPNNKNTKDVSKCKIWDIEWDSKDKNGKFEITTVKMDHISIRSGVIWGIKDLCDKAGIPFTHKYLDLTMAPKWYWQQCAFRNEYELEKILGHHPKSAKSKNAVVSYKVKWAFGTEGTVKVKNLVKAKEFVEEYWKNQS